MVETERLVEVDEGDELKIFDDTLLKVKFRLSDHTSKDITDNLSSKEPGVFSLFRSFIVKGVEHENVLEVLKTVNKVCENIKKGKV